MPRTKIVFLYTELAGYFLACVKELSKSADVLVVRWPVNQEAPFDFDEDDSVEILNRKQFSDQELAEKIQDFQPDMLVCSGWIDKTYLKISKSFKRKIPVVLTLDNHWTGTLKQRIATLISPFYLKKIFTHAWVPGEPQFQFAQKLGFGKNILRNFYCADTDLFDKMFLATFKEKTRHLPHRFLYVGRYVQHKGIFELWKAFAELQEELNNDWELWCLGTGEEWENRLEHDKIKHFGFVQPAEIQQYISETSVYILPSRFEPWGVTVQEFAISGFPMLLSDAIGSREKFLDKNGYIFENGNVSDLKIKMKKMMTVSNDELIEMGNQSHALGMRLTPEIWTKNLLTILTKG